MANILLTYKEDNSGDIGLQDRCYYNSNLSITAIIIDLICRQMNGVQVTVSTLKGEHRRFECIFTKPITMASSQILSPDSSASDD